MQQIYTQTHEEFEVFTTVFSPQVCRKRIVLQQLGEMVVVAADYSADCDDELSVRAGEVVMFLYQEDADWCYARVRSGKEGFLPLACFTQQNPQPKRPPVMKQNSVQESSSDRSSFGGGHPLKLLRRASLSGVPSSPRLLQRLLSRPRRRSDGQTVRSHGSVNPGFNPD